MNLVWNVNNPLSCCNVRRLDLYIVDPQASEYVSALDKAVFCANNRILPFQPKGHSFLASADTILLYFTHNI